MCADVCTSEVGEMLATQPDVPSVPELEVRGLVKRYTRQSIVGPISFSVNAGEFVSLLGPSGCGKTTTLRCIAGFEAPDEGSILLGGTRIERDPPNRRNVGLVFQNYALFPHLTVFANVAFGLRLRKLGKSVIAERVHRALDIVDLREFADRYPAQLSGGQQQRVAIARSVVLEPRVLLFDEPLSNLDLKLRLQMRTELRALQQRLGKTAVYVTHDQGEALALSDRIVVMSKGTIEQIGSPRDIYERPASAFVADFIGSSNLIEVTILEIAPTTTLVRSKQGVLFRVAQSAYREGDRAIAVIRPEHVRLAPERSAQPDETPLSAVIETATYLGQEVQLQLRVEDAHSLVALVHGAKRPYVTGERVEIAIPADVVRLIAAAR